MIIPGNDNVAISTIETFESQLFWAIICDVNVCPTATGIHDCSVGIPIIWGRVGHDDALITWTRNCTSTELSGVILDELIKSSTYTQV